MELTTINVRLRLLTDMLGTTPKNKEVYAKFIETKKAERVDAENADAVEVETVEEIEEKGWTGFRTDEAGIFLPDYMIKGFIKNAGNVMKAALSKKNLSSKINNLVFITPQRIRLERDGQPIREAEGIYERPLRAMTMQGPRVSLARSDVVKEGAEMAFAISIMPNTEIAPDLLKELFEYGKLMGLGQFRNGSFGRIEVFEWR